jgi:hypothetical protein
VERMRIVYTVVSVARWGVQCIIQELLKGVCVRTEEGQVRREEEALGGMSDLESGWEVRELELQHGLNDLDKTEVVVRGRKVKKLV